MSFKESPRTRKRIRQSTLGLSPQGQPKLRKISVAPDDNDRGAWDHRKGLITFIPHAWKPDAIRAKYGEDAPIKVAAFDLDSTLITTKTRAKFPKTPHDWKFVFQAVANKLNALSDEGYLLVLFTNQAGVGNGRITDLFVKTRIAAIMADVRADMGAFVATGKDNYRKPGTGMWEEFAQSIGGLQLIDPTNSFYVGDAAGRPARPGGDKDFSDSDLRFSINIGLPFRTPEEYFANKKSEAVSASNLKGFDPRTILQTASDVTLLDGTTNLEALLTKSLSPPDVAKDLIMGGAAPDERPAAQTMVLMHGMPASGKTSFVRRHLLSRGYIWINQDTMQTFARCARATREALASGYSVVIDNTNPNKKARGRYIEIGKGCNQGLKILALSMKTPKDLAQHLNIVRERESKGGVQHIPVVAYHMFLKRASPPELEEGIDRIADIKFLPCFSSEREQYIFTRLT